jgi:hypothetical protein
MTAWSVGSRRSPLDGRDHDAALFGVEIVEDSVIANTPAPARGLQAFDVAAEGIGCELV